MLDFVTEIENKSLCEIGISYEDLNAYKYDNAFMYRIYVW